MCTASTESGHVVGSLPWSQALVRRLTLSAVALLLFLPILSTSDVRAATRCVNPGGTGGCFALIQDAVTASSSGDTITVAAGTYAGLVTVNTVLTITGAGASTTTINGGLHNMGILTLSGLTVTTNNSGISGIVNDASASLALYGVTVTGNTAAAFFAAFGGGINNAGTLTMLVCTIQGNVSHNTGEDIDSSKGGGIFNSGTVTMTSVTVSGNGTAFGGAGIANAATGQMTIIGSIISGNGAANGFGSFGIGIDNAGTLTLTNSTISGNILDFMGAGGGINNTGILTVTGSTISGNRLDNAMFDNLGFGGGGILNRTGGVLTVTNSTISDNFVAGGFNHNGFGGGIDNRGTATLTNVTLAGNNNNGLSADGIAASAGSITLRDTLLANPGANCFGTLTSNDYNLSSDTSCITFIQPHDQMNANPKLGSLAYNGGPTQTQALLPGSPAIDTGGVTCPAGVTVDQRGFTRPSGAGCDIGAYEYTVPTVTPPQRPGPILPPPPSPSAVPVPRPGATTGGPPAPVPTGR